MKNDNEELVWLAKSYPREKKKTLKIPEDLHERVEKIIGSHHRNFTDIVIVALESYLKKYHRR